MKTIKKQKDSINEMHGRQRRIEEITPKEIEQDHIKAIKLEKASIAVLSIIHKKDYSPESFHLTSVLAKLNPDIYSIWNYRKDYLSIFINKDNVTEEDKLELLKKEITLTEDIIRDKDTKRPCLLTVNEIRLCSTLLKLDQRNFHCWNHWMLICRQMNVTTEEMLSFTWQRIEENTSNYSAWHYRGQLLDRLLTEKYHENAVECRKLIETELDVNLNALYTECDDQSSWYYMRTLLYIAVRMEKQGILRRKDILEIIDKRVSELRELVDFAPDCIYGETFIAEIAEMRELEI